MLARHNEYYDLEGKSLGSKRDPGKGVENGYTNKSNSGISLGHARLLCSCRNRYVSSEASGGGRMRQVLTRPGGNPKAGRKENSFYTASYRAPYSPARPLQGNS